MDRKQQNLTVNFHPYGGKYQITTLDFRPYKQKVTFTTLLSCNNYYWLFVASASWLACRLTSPQAVQSTTGHTCKLSHYPLTLLVEWQGDYPSYKNLCQLVTPQSLMSLLGVHALPVVNAVTRSLKSTAQSRAVRIWTIKIGFDPAADSIWIHSTKIGFIRVQYSNRFEPLYRKPKMVAMARSLRCRVSTVAVPAFCLPTTQHPSITNCLVAIIHTTPDNSNFNPKIGCHGNGP